MLLVLMMTFAHLILVSGYRCSLLLLLLIAIIIAIIAIIIAIIAIIIAIIAIIIACRIELAKCPDDIEISSLRIRIYHVQFLPVWRIWMWICV